MGFSGVWMAASLLLFVVAWWNQDTLPDPSTIEPPLRFEPEQTATREQPFTTEVGGIVYRVEPLFDYELAGLMVSGHDTGSWRDYLHAKWNDHLNVADICVLWGTNVLDDLYHAFEFSSGQFTCNFRTDSREAFTKFDLTAIANNHLLTDDPGIAAAIRSARIGDQVRIRGVLAKYSHREGGGFSRGTSTTRNDTGNGACETIFVRDFEIIRRADSPWRPLKWLALCSLLAAIAVWLWMPVRVRA